jgi:hypothetical protein
MSALFVKTTSRTVALKDVALTKPSRMATAIALNMKLRGKH